MKMLLSVAAGGAIGASGRYLVSVLVTRVAGHGFPYATFIENVLGCLLLGALVEFMALHWSPSQEMRAFLVIGVLGAFTTFSAFSLDAVSLFERGQLGLAGIYVAGSVVLSLAGFVAGMMALRAVLA